MKALVVLLLLTACHPRFYDCGDRVIAEVESPDGRYVATIYERDCGATTDYSTNVSLREKAQEFDPANQSPVLIVDGRSPVTVAWTADGALSIGMPDVPDEKVFRKVQVWRQVQIVFLTASQRMSANVDQDD